MFLIIFSLKVLLITILIYINRLPMSWIMTNNFIFIWLLSIGQDGQVCVLKTKIYWKVMVLIKLNKLKIIIVFF